MARVYNKRYNDAPPDAIYVGRPSIYGNKFTHIKDKETLAEFIVGSVQESVDAYFKMILAEFPKLDTPKAREFFGPLVGRDLVCWCVEKGGRWHNDRPMICHAQVLAALAEAHGMLKVKENAD